MSRWQLTMWIAAASAAILSGASPTVLLDEFHNNETKIPDHYHWDGTKAGGLSELGKVLVSIGCVPKPLHEPESDKTLAEARVLIVVDPDTTAEADQPKYFTAAEIQAIDKWVKRGGQLVLLGNDKGNAEFEHFNRLAGRFGIQFLESTYPKTTGKGILIAHGEHSFFDSGGTVYLVEVAPLQVRQPGDIVLADQGTAIMALVKHGKGRVFAVGDPWLYNEYIDRKDNRRVSQRLFEILTATP
jgi:unsaturated rhamnogalacturonyl hydrolase